VFGVANREQAAARLGHPATLLALADEVVQWRIVAVNESVIGTKLPVSSGCSYATAIEGTPDMRHTRKFTTDR
jgi:hypothetical protein